MTKTVSMHSNRDGRIYQERRLFVYWKSNLIYHYIALTGVLTLSFIWFYFLESPYELLSWNILTHLTMKVFMINIFTPVVVVLYIILSILYFQISRIHIDLISDTVVWECYSIQNCLIAHRTLSEATGVLIPQQSLLFPRPPRLLFPDGELPIEIRRPWRSKASVKIARDIAAFTKLPLTEA